MFIQDLDATPSAPLQQQVRTFYASQAITAGQLVSLDASKSGTAIPTYVKLSDENGDANAFLFCGVALEAASTGDKVRVCTAGYVADVVADAGISAKAWIVVSATEGSSKTIPAQTDAAAAIRPIGVALTATSGGKINAWIYPTGF